MDTEKAWEELQRIGVARKNQKEFTTEQFLSAVDQIPDDEIDQISQNVADCYNRLRDLHEATEIKNSVESFKKSNMENKMSEEQTKTILEIFAFWEKGGFASVEVPEEATEKELKEIFLTTMKEMPYEKKAAGGMTQEIYDLQIDLIQKKSKRVKKSNVRNPQELEYIGSLVKTAEIINQYLESPVTLTNIESARHTETQILGMIFDETTEESFVELMKEEPVAKLVKKLGLERKISSIVTKSGKKSRIVKKWDGEGEPFAEQTPTKQPSMRYWLWKKVLEKDQSISKLNKAANKEFGQKGTGEPRDVTRTLVQMGRKVSDFYKIEISGDTVTVSKV